MASARVHKPHKKHVRKWHRGRPVKAKVPKRDRPGRPALHAPDEQQRSMVRHRADEALRWDAAAAAYGAKLGMGKTLTRGPWLRMLANTHADQLLGAPDVPPVSLPEDAVDDVIEGDIGSDDAPGVPS